MANDITKPGLPALVYRGEVIHERQEMLSLTDMWKAAGADDQKGPAKWRALPTTKAFAEHVGTVVGKSDNALFRSQRGGPDQGTWAHWHVAMAYAKYLDHDFHMWCNTVVRERMEGHVTAALPSDMAEQIRRTDGIVRMMAGKLTAMQDRIDSLEEKKAVPALDFGGTVSAYQIIEMAGVAAKDRQRGTAQMVTKRLISFCAERQTACFRTPAEVNPSRPFRFPHALVSEWLLGTTKGIELIRNQITKAKAKKIKARYDGGQSALQLVPQA